MNIKHILFILKMNILLYNLLIDIFTNNCLKLTILKICKNVGTNET